MFIGVVSDVLLNQHFLAAYVYFTVDVCTCVSVPIGMEKISRALPGTPLQHTKVLASQLYHRRFVSMFSINMMS